MGQFFVLFFNITENKKNRINLKKKIKKLLSFNTDVQLCYP